jgi:hypothetical protein
MAQGSGGMRALILDDVTEIDLWTWIVAVDG